jgi:hypothetical protein
VLGVGVLLGGSLPWGAALALNQRLLPSVPWAIAPMTLYLWLYRRFIGGSAGTAEGAAVRRTNLRANPVAPNVWMRALVTELVGFGALIALLILMARLMTMPDAAPRQS